MEEAAYLEPSHNFIQDLRARDGLSTEPFEVFLKNASCFPAARQSQVVRQYRLETKGWKKKITQNAGWVVRELLSGDSENILILSIDLTRSKEAILEEVADLITAAKSERGTKETRLKWLSIVDELLKVWDAWDGYGQRRCFHLVARKLKVPESTVKARWRLAYQLINGKEYSKEQAAASADELCAKCKDQGKCYRVVNGVMDFYPCTAYLKLTGESCTRERLLENFDAVADKYISDTF